MNSIAQTQPKEKKISKIAVISLFMGIIGIMLVATIISIPH